MPRKDLENRNDLGMFKTKYDEPLNHKSYGVRLFKSDSEKIEAIATDRGIATTDLIRSIVHEWLTKPHI